jgi:transcriptional regulator with XRE-family HTH domain
MIPGDRLHDLRIAKQMSPADIEERTGLSQSYVLRVENGHAIPDIETLEEWAEVLGVPVYKLFYEGEQPPQLVNLRGGLSADDIVRGSAGKVLSLFGKSH